MPCYSSDEQKSFLLSVSKEENEKWLLKSKQHYLSGLEYNDSPGELHMGWSARSSEPGLNKQKSSLSRDLKRTILIWGNGRNSAEILRNPDQWGQETYTFYRKLKEISPGCSLEGLMLKLKLQCFGHLMRRADSFEKLWCWEGLKAGGERDDRGWDGWMASLTQWIHVWVDSGSWWRTGRPAYCSSWGHKESDTAEQLNWMVIMRDS